MKRSMFEDDFMDVEELMDTTLPPLNWWNFTEDCVIGKLCGTMSSTIV